MPSGAAALLKTVLERGTRLMFWFFFFLLLRLTAPSRPAAQVNRLKLDLQREKKHSREDAPHYSTKETEWTKAIRQKVPLSSARRAHAMCEDGRWAAIFTVTVEKKERIKVRRRRWTEKRVFFWTKSMVVLLVVHKIEHICGILCYLLSLSLSFFIISAIFEPLEMLQYINSLKM